MGRKEQIRNENMKKWIYVSIVILLFCIFSFFTVFYLYNKNLEKIASDSIIDYSATDEIDNSEETIDVSFSEDKDIETVVLKNVENENTNETTNESVKTNGKADELAAVENNTQDTNDNSQVQSSNQEVVDNTVKNEALNIVQTAEVSQVVDNVENVVPITQELEFESPVSGEIIKDYAEETLVYSKTLDEWGVHLGIDIKANKTTIVKAAEAGVIEKINTDPRYGNSITINHGNGFKTIYSSLLVSDFFKVGEQVEKGDTIGTVGDSANFEIAEESHLHFEMYKDGKHVNPTLYLK